MGVLKRTLMELKVDLSCKRTIEAKAD